MGSKFGVSEAEGGVIAVNEIADRLAKRLFDSKIIQNQYRSAFVEAMIEPTLQKANWHYTGDSWCGWDFERKDGARLEVKQSAAVQTWSEARKIRTKGAFDIAPRTGYFSENGAKWNATPGRPADIYVFAWNAKDDHRIVENWDFLVIPTCELPNQKTISRDKILRLATKTGQTAAISIDELESRISKVLIDHPSSRIDNLKAPA